MKQTPRAWNKRTDSFLTKLDFNKCTLENEVYVKESNEQNQVIMCLYVDDLLVIGSNEDELTKFKASMVNKFEMPDLGNLAYFLGMEIMNTKHGVFLNHKKHSEDILKKFKMRNNNPAIIPMETNIKLNKELEDEMVYNIAYKQIIGLSRYLCNKRYILII